jgi:hypothetical protein
MKIKSHPFSNILLMNIHLLSSSARVTLLENAFAKEIIHVVAHLFIVTTKVVSCLLPLATIFQHKQAKHHQHKIINYNTSCNITTTLVVTQH